MDAPRAIPWVPVLMYHRVVPRRVQPDPYGIFVSVEELDTQMRSLKSSGYRSISMDEWARTVRNGEQPKPKRVIITFDDGYLDVLLHALPVLRRYEYTATVFLVSGCVGKTNAWDHGKAPETRLLGPEHLRELRQSGFSFGSHSATHRSLPRLTQEEAWEEIAGSKAALEEVLETEVLSFCFPYGNSNPLVRSMVQEAGYQSACGNHQREHTLFNATRIDAAQFHRPGLMWRANVAGLRFLLRQNPLLRRAKRLTPGGRRRASRQAAARNAAPTAPPKP